MPRDSRRRSPESSRRRRTKEPDPEPDRERDRERARERERDRAAPSSSSNMPGPMPGSMPDDPEDVRDRGPSEYDPSRTKYSQPQTTRSDPRVPAQYSYYSAEYQPDGQQQYQRPPDQYYSQSQSFSQQYPPSQVPYQQSPSQYAPSQYPSQYPPQHSQSQSQPMPPPSQFPAYGQPETARPNGGAFQSDSSSDTSSSFLNISRRAPKYGGIFNTFFRSPSAQRQQRQRHRARRTKKTNTRFLSFGNSSSSSVDSDLAYGSGFIPKEKDWRKKQQPQERQHPHQQQHLQRQQSREQYPGQYAQQQGQQQYGPGVRGSQYGGGLGAQRPRHSDPSATRTKTDEEIIDIGRQLSDIARKQNDADLRASGKVRPSQLVGAAAALSTFRRSKTKDSADRGIGSSKPHGRDSEDSEWESAEDDDSDSDPDPALAFGSTADLPSQPSRYGPPKRSDSIVDPTLFGPQNSLRGVVNTPCGFDDPRAPYQGPRPGQAAPPSNAANAPMRHVVPVPTSDPNNFDYDRVSRTSSQQGGRPGPVPLQQPVPKAPVSSKVYDAERLAEDERRYRDRDQDRDRRSSDGRSLAGMAAAAGVAATAVGVAAAAGRKDSRDPRDYRGDDRRDDYERSVRDDRTQPRDQDDRRRRSYRDNNVKIVDERDQRDQRDGRDYRDDRRSTRGEDPYQSDLKRRHTAPVDNRDSVSYKLPHGEEIRVDYDRERDQDRRRRDEPRDLPRSCANAEPPPSDTYYKSRPREQPAEPSSSSSKNIQPVEVAEAPASRAHVDPFQFQVADFTAPKRPLTPQVVTVDREPKFDQSPPRASASSAADTRLSRKDSFEIEQRLERYNQGSRERSKTPNPTRQRHTYEEEEHAAKAIYDETKHSTAPIAAAAVAAAVAIEGERSREERRRHRQETVGTSQSSSRDRAERDAVQEEADRYYRETVIARKIAEDEIRSRSASPHHESVVDKWDEDTRGKDDDDTSKAITIVTPPEMDKEHDKSPYDAPNADVRIDHVIVPKELTRFRVSDGQLDPSDAGPLFKSRDPSCERDRPLLNLVLPTPLSTPNPEKQARERERQERAERAERAEKERQEKAESSEPREVPDVVIGPKGDVQTPSTPKSVSWGENETKRFEVESPEPPTSTAREEEPAAAKPRSAVSTGSRWGILAAALAGGAAASTKGDKKDASSGDDKTKEEPETTSRSIADDDEPPIPGPKPASPRETQMPGGFGDDLEFTSVVAAGLEDTGFDPNIVIDDPSFRRRDSPPGSDEPSLYQKPFAETVTDLGIHGDDASRDRSGGPDTGFVVGEVEDSTSREKETVDDEWETPTKMSKKERKKREKAMQNRQSTDDYDAPAIADDQASSSVSAGDVDQPIEKLSKKERKKREKAAKAETVIIQDDAPSRAVDADDYVSSSQPAEEVPDEWEAPSSSSKKSKKGKKKGKKSALADDDDNDKDNDRVSVPIDAFNDLQSSRDDAEPAADEWDDVPSKKSKKSKRDSAAYDSPSRSAPASEVSVRSTSSKSGKDRRKSGGDYAEGDDDYIDDRGGDPPDRSHRFIDDRDVTSVVSDPAGRYERRYNGSRYEDGDEVKSVASFASAPDGRKRSSKDGKRSSKEKEREQEKRGSGSFFGLFGRNGSTADKDRDSNSNKSSDKNDEQSFLGSAGTLGAGVGLAGAAVALGHAASRHNAADASSEKERALVEMETGEGDVPSGRNRSRSFRRDYVDPEIVQRAIKPAIDPQYGDLLPLPPSEPGSPTEEYEDLPSLPESRPETPPEERDRLRRKVTHVRRRSAIETPTKSPSHTAIPIQLRLGQRSTPSSPAFLKSSPMASPVATAPELSTPRRPTSWDSSREIKPLYLLEQARQGQAVDDAAELPELPPSDVSSRESPSPFLDAQDTWSKEINWEPALTHEGPLRLDTDIPPEILAGDGLGSQESTPKAHRGLAHADKMVSEEELLGLPPLPDSSITTSPGMEPKQEPEGEFDPEPVEPMSKDRSSYLLHSTPPSVKKSIEGTKSLDAEGTPSKRGDPVADDQETSPRSGAWGAVAAAAVGGTAAAALLHSLDERDEEKSADAQVDDAATPPRAPPAEDCDAFAGVDTKKKKKGKKGRKEKSVHAEESSDLPPSSEDPTTTESSDAIVEATSVSAPSEPALEEFEPKLSKKAKKKAKKGRSLEAEPGIIEKVTPREADEAFAPLEEVAPQTRSATLDETIADEHEPPKETAETETDIIPVLGLSKKDKKKKKKGKKSLAWGEEPSTESSTEPSTSEELSGVPSISEEHAITRSLVGEPEIIPQAGEEPAALSTAEPALPIQEPAVGVEDEDASRARGPEGDRGLADEGTDPTTQDSALLEPTSTLLVEDKPRDHVPDDVSDIFFDADEDATPTMESAEFPGLGPVDVTLPSTSDVPAEDVPPTTGSDLTYPEEPADPIPTKSTAQDEPTAPEEPEIWSTPPRERKKKKGKKGKKDELQLDDAEKADTTTSAEPVPDPFADAGPSHPSVDLVRSLDESGPALDTATAEAPVEEEWAPTPKGKKQKKKQKQKGKGLFTESQPAAGEGEADKSTFMSPSFTEAPAGGALPVADDAPRDGSFDEPATEEAQPEVEAERSTPDESTTETAPEPILVESKGKKSKKKKKEKNRKSVSFDLALAPEPSEESSESRVLYDDADTTEMPESGAEVQPAHPPTDATETLGSTEIPSEPTFASEIDSWDAIDRLTATRDAGEGLQETHQGDVPATPPAEDRGPVHSEDKSPEDTPMTDAQPVEHIFTDSAHGSDAPQELSGPALADVTTIADESQGGSFGDDVAQVTISRDVGLDVAEMAVAAPEPARPDDDEWQATTSTKKGKKDKKKKKQSASFAELEPEPVLKGEDSGISGLALSQEEPSQTESSQPPATDILAEDDWSQPHSTKKSKKGKKKAAQVLSWEDDEPTTPPQEESTSTQEASGDLSQVAAQTSPPQPAKEEEVDEWAVQPVGKKGKKGKKGKAVESFSWDEDVSRSLDGSKQGDDSTESPADVDQPQEPSDPAPQADAVPAAIEDDWANHSTGKKGKKGKKNKAFVPAALSWDEEVSQSLEETKSSEDVSRSLEDATTSLASVPTAGSDEAGEASAAVHDSWATQPTGKKGKKGKKNKLSVVGTTSLGDEPSRSLQEDKPVEEATGEAPKDQDQDETTLSRSVDQPGTSSAAVEDDDSWATQTTGKKGKKGKKKKAMASFAWDEPEPEPEPEPVPEPQPEVASEAVDQPITVEPIPEISSQKDEPLPIDIPPVVDDAAPQAREEDTEKPATLLDPSNETPAPSTDPPVDIPRSITPSGGEPERTLPVEAADDEWDAPRPGKKGKKNKKKQREATFLADDPTPTSRDVIAEQSQPVEGPYTTPEEVPQPVPEEAAPAVEEVPFEMPTKKPKKGKKRQSLLVSALDDSSPAAESLSEPSSDLSGVESKQDIPPDAEWGFETTGKKGKKGKKKRQSVTFAEADSETPPKADSSAGIPAEAPTTSDQAPEPIGDRDSATRDLPAVDDDVIMAEPEPLESLPALPAAESGAAEGKSVDALTEAAQTSEPHPLSNEVAEEAAAPALEEGAAEATSLQALEGGPPGTMSVDDGEPISLTEPAPEPKPVEEDESFFFTKKSKKKKNKKGSTSRDEPDDWAAEMDAEAAKQMPSESDSMSVDGPVPAVAEEEFAPVGGKSKKDKKKKKALLATALLSSMVSQPEASGSSTEEPLATQERAFDDPVSTDQSAKSLPQAVSSSFADETRGLPTDSVPVPAPPPSEDANQEPAVADAQPSEEPLTTTSEPAPESFADVPISRKLSNKDKKKKKGKALQDDFLPEPSSLETSATVDPGVTDDPQPAQAPTLDAPVLEETRPIDDPEANVPTEEVPDIFVTKKSKKDKKKRKSKGLEDFDSGSGTATPVGETMQDQDMAPESSIAAVEPTDALPGESNLPDVDRDLNPNVPLAFDGPVADMDLDRDTLPAPIATDAPFSEEPLPQEDAPAVAIEGMELSQDATQAPFDEPPQETFVLKKSKKDKKKKKRESQVEPASQPESPSLQPIPLPLSQETTLGDPLEPAAVGPEDAGAPDEWAQFAVTKKGKKGKKKNKEQEKSADDTPQPDVSVPSDDTPLDVAMDASPTISREIEEPEAPVVPDFTAPPAEEQPSAAASADEWSGFSTKKSKKDKKKKKAKAPESPQPESESAIPQPDVPADEDKSRDLDIAPERSIDVTPAIFEDTTPLVPEQENVVEPPTDDPSVPQDRSVPVDEWAESRGKKAKKDKKKKKRQSLAWDEEVASMPEIQEPDQPSTEVEEPIGDKAMSSSTEDLAPIQELEPLATAEEASTVPDELPQEPVAAIDSRATVDVDPLLAFHDTETAETLTLPTQVEDVVVDQPFTDPIDAQKGLPTATEEPTTGLPAQVSSVETAAEPDEFFAVKKSKKDKKKKRGSQVQPGIDEAPTPPFEEAPSTIPPPDDAPPSDLPPSEPKLEGPPMGEDLTSSPAIETFITKKSKKDKKKSKQRQSWADSEPTSSVDDSTGGTSIPGNNVEIVSAPVAEPQEEGKDLSTESGPPAQEIPAAAAGDQISDPVPSTEEADWGTFQVSRKKSKKGKKGKASVESSQPASRALSPVRGPAGLDVEEPSKTTDETTQGLPTPQEIGLAAEEARTIDEQPQDAIAEVVEPAPLPVSDLPEPPVADDEWAVPTKSKKKKGKKGKMSVTSIDSEPPSRALSPTLPPPEPLPETEAAVVEEAPLDEPMISVTEPGSDATPLPEPLDATSTPMDDDWALPTTTKKSKKNKKGKATSSISGSEPVSRALSPVQEAVAPAAVETTAAATEPVEAQPTQDDEWGFTSTKKSKKDKKRSKGSVSVSRNLSPTREEPSTVPEPVQAPSGSETPQTEDSWDVLVTSKKSKKGKKGKRSSLGGGTAESSPRASTQNLEPEFAGEKTTAAEVDVPNPSQDPWEQDNVPRSISPKPDDSASWGKMAAAAVAGGTAAYAAATAFSSSRETEQDDSATREIYPQSKAALGEDSMPGVNMAKELDIDMTPAQEGSSLVHDAPFELADERKKARTEEEKDETVLDEPIVGSREIAAAYLAGDEPYSSQKDADVEAKAPGMSSSDEADAGQSAPEALPSMDDVWGDDADDVDNAKPDQATPRGLAASYFEQPREQHSSEKSADKAAAPPPSPPSNKSTPKSSPTKSAFKAGAAAAGVAALAQQFGGGGKKKKKGKGKKKYEDKQPGGPDDLFDDPVLWEGADKKHVSEAASVEVEKFWGTTAGEEDDVTVDPYGENVVRERGVLGDDGSEEGVGREGEVFAPAPSADDDIMKGEDGPADDSTGLRSFQQEGQERPGVARIEQLKAVEDDEAESPVLGREGSYRDEQVERSVVADEDQTPRALADIPRPSIEHMDIDEAVDRGFEAERRRDMSEATPTDDDYNPTWEAVPAPDFKRSVSRGLPPVLEEAGEETEQAAQPRSLPRQAPWTPEMNRDSGFISDSPQQTRHGGERRSLATVEQDNRDSGVHLREYDSTSREAPAEREYAVTPQRQRGLGHDGYDESGHSSRSRRQVSPESRSEHRSIPEEQHRQFPMPRTPVLRGPEPREATPEPQKSSSVIKARSPELEKRSRYRQDDSGIAPAVASYGRAATSTPTGHRSVSDQTPRHARHSPAPGEHSKISPAPTGGLRRSLSNTSLARRRTATPEPLGLVRSDSPASGIHRQASATPPLRRVDKRVSGDLRSLSQRSQVNLSAADSVPGATSGAGALAGAGPPQSTATPTPSQSQSQSQLLSKDKAAATIAAGVVAAGAAGAFAASSQTPTANEGRARVNKDMADVYDGYGEGRIGSPRSPTRPHSMRRRQSMQVLELESRLEQLTAENRMLADAKAEADATYNQRTAGVLAERNAEIDHLKQSLEHFQKEVARLTEVNEGLNSANAQLATQQKQHNDRFGVLAAPGETSRGLGGGSPDEILQQKDEEIEMLRSELDAAKDKIREMQQQILAAKAGDSDFLNIRDIDHFDHRCQQLCSHVQQWVLRFSKFSDMRSCRLTSELNDEKVIDRLDNAVLDGSDVDTYLADRVRRRDVFMSMTMNMIWEFVFTRYLFGMDREQRQKLKSLEKLLTEVGPAKAVRQWRAVTLTLLSNRPSFQDQRELDTEAVVQAVFHTLSKVLPPPSNLEEQIQSQLRRVMREAVDLAVEMRTQRAEYMMLPPLQPTYDEDGELAETVPFNASLMNERSGDASLSNEDLQNQGAVVRIVLFPLVVRKGDDVGEGDEEIVVCPAQVLIARDNERRRRSGAPSGAGRLLTPSSDAGGASLGPHTMTNKSDISMQTEGTYQGRRTDMQTPEAEYIEGGI